MNRDSIWDRLWNDWIGPLLFLGAIIAILYFVINTIINTKT